MARIKFNVNGTTYSTWNHTTKITTPSLILNDNGTLRYTPLFAVNNGAEATLDNHWYYRCGALAVTHNNTKYHVAISRRYTNVLSGTISTTITHSGKTGTTTTTTSKTVTPTGTHNFGYQDIPPGGQSVSADVTVNYGVTFLQTPAIYIHYGGTLVSVGTSSCVIRMYSNVVNSGTSPSYMDAGSVKYLLTVTGNVATTTTTYPNETKSAVAQGNFNYGVTYPSAPNLWTDGSGIAVYNNNGNASCHVSKTLSGTVAFGKSATLSHNFAVGFNGDLGLG
uniref:hypothetical protein n=1 Tax=Succinivibrio sp. TaxID=2053619 RepID=UPI003FEF8811